MDHVSLWDAATGDVFVGDMLMKRGSVLIPAGKGGNLRAYLDSLHRLSALGSTRFYPGHGPVIDDPLKTIAEALEHRRRREEQVLACLADGVTDVDGIVARLYVGLEEGLERAARMTVTAHLDKLREEGLLP
jgi:glyoxylase-like metal-dependent hydrolase (beta-lactamase superfamily II)